jgi:predicted esterase
MAPRDMVSRRELIRSLLCAAGASSSWLTPGRAGTQANAEQRLMARPGKPGRTAPAGRHEFSTRSSSGVVYAAPRVDRDQPAPLVLFLHGAGRTVDAYLDAHRALADELGLIVLAPFSAISTWDAISGKFGGDVSRIDQALKWTFDRWTIDAGRIGLSGFSDGGTYTLALGRANGDLFARLAAYSPGFLIPVTPVGKPPILISHGVADTVLPIDRTSRRIVPELQRRGYEVDYREFDGPHAVSRTAMEAFLKAMAG